MTKIVLCGALFGLVSMSAQDTALIEKKMDEMKAHTTELKILGASMINGPTVKGAPYSAQAVSEMVQTLADGNRITNTSTSTLYRDSQGRERREESSGDGKSVFITDPTEGSSYTLEPDSNVAIKHARRSVGFTNVYTGNGAGVGVGTGHGGTITTDTRTFVFNSGGNGSEAFVFSNREAGTSKSKPNVENLGTQVIEGVSVEGTRTTVTIPAGQIGNEQPIVIVSERWYSPELQVTVMTKRSDPRTGTTTYKLTNINRAEPSAALFQVPADFTVKSDVGVIKPMILKDRQEDQN